MPPRNSIDHTTMREMNISLVLDTLRQRAPISRAALAAQTGLNKTSVSNIVKDLIAGRFIWETGIDETLSEIGRPAVNLQLNPEAGFLISAEIGVGFISVVVANFAFEVTMRRYESTLHLSGREAVLDYFVDLLQDVYTAVQRYQRPIFGLVVGIPGLVDMQTGTLLFAPNLDWRDVPLRERLQPHFDVPILIANEANMAALGEYYLGPARHSRLLLFISSGVGLGGGLVVDGHLLTGVNGLAGELGHMTVDPTGLACRCGNHGCWETQATLTALYRRVREAIDAGRKTSLSRFKDQLTLPVLREAAHSGDAVALEAFQETGRWLGIGMANLVNALSPEHLVFGGQLSVAVDLLRPTMAAELEKRALRWIVEQVKFTTATYTADAALMGGVAMIHNHVVHHPMTWRAPAEFWIS